MNRILPTTRVNITARTIAEANGIYSLTPGFKIRKSPGKVGRLGFKKFA